MMQVRATRVTLGRDAEGGGVSERCVSASIRFDPTGQERCRNQKKGDDAVCFHIASWCLRLTSARRQSLTFWLSKGKHNYGHRGRCHLYAKNRVSRSSIAASVHRYRTVFGYCCSSVVFASSANVARCGVRNTQPITSNIKHRIAHRDHYSHQAEPSCSSRLIEYGCAA